MKRLLPISIVFLLLAAPVWGQDYPRVEVFGGFSYLDVVVDDVFAGASEERFYGWQASISGNFHENIGLVFDVGGQYKSVLDITTQFYEFLVGPRFRTQNEPVTGFAHALVGLMHARVSGLGDTLSDTALALGFGGGVDVNVSDVVAIRAFQTDFLVDHFVDEWHWNFRVGSGIVFKFGD